LTNLTQTSTTNTDNSDNRFGFLITQLCWNI